MCVCLLSLYFLYTQVLGANKCYYMNKITMTWIEILHICLEMFGSRVMAVFAYLEDRGIQNTVRRAAHSEDEIDS